MLSQLLIFLARKKTYSYFLHEFNADMQTELSGQSDQAP